MAEADVASPVPGAAPSGKGRTDLHVIFGAGPAACWTARALRAQGAEVMAVNRSGRHPALMPTDVPVIAADAMVQEQAHEAASGASVVYQMLGPAYTRWAEEFPTLQAHTISAARKAGARYVALENLYMLDSGSTMTENSPQGPRSGKGRLRQDMHHALMAHHQQGDLVACVLRASDFFGPGVLVSGFGERLFGRLASGKSPQLMVRADALHSVAYIADVGAAMAALGMAGKDTPVWGQTWLAPHAPPMTQAQFVGLACQALGRTLSGSVVAPWMMHLVGLFDKDARESIEMLYQYAEPFVVDATASQKILGLVPTSPAPAIRATLDWYLLQRAGH